MVLMPFNKSITAYNSHQHNDYIYKQTMHNDETKNESNIKYDILNRKVVKVPEIKGRSMRIYYSPPPSHSSIEFGLAKI